MTDPPRTRRQIFRDWHGEPSLWREIYTRTVSALVAALVIYLVAAAAGLVSRQPLVIVLVLGSAGMVWMTVHSIVGWRRSVRARKHSVLTAQDKALSQAQSAHILADVMQSAAVAIAFAVMAWGVASGLSIGQILLGG